MDFNDYNGNIDFLCRCLVEIKNSDEAASFLTDLCTVRELASMSQRLQVAKMLTEGKVYKVIVSETGASTATISRVNRSLQYGANGYKELFRRVKDEKNV